MELVMKSGIQHRMNPLHIYCRLIELGVSKKRAKKICILLKKTVCRLCYRRQD